MELGCTWMPSKTKKNKKNKNKKNNRKRSNINRKRTENDRKQRRNEAFEFDSSCGAPQRAPQLESNSNAAMAPKEKSI